MSQYGGFTQGQNGYNANLDVVLYRTNDVCFSGKQNQNQFFLQLRSYNNTFPKLEFFRATPTQSNPELKRSFRVTKEEWEYIKTHINEIDQAWNQLLSGQAQPPQQPQQQMNNQFPQMAQGGPF